MADIFDITNYPSNWDSTYEILTPRLNIWEFCLLHPELQHLHTNTPWHTK